LSREEKIKLGAPFRDFDCLRFVTPVAEVVSVADELNCVVGLLGEDLGVAFADLMEV
jgi:hypothetical protein